MALTKITNSAIADDIGLGGNPTTSTQTAGDSTTRIATTAFVSTAVANLVDSAPETLNTLAELATSIGNNATLSSTLTTSIATKLPLAGGTLTGHLNLGDNVQARFGTDNDLQIYHDGSHARLRTATGNFNIQTNDFHLTDASNVAVSFLVDHDGATSIRYNQYEKLATTNTGIAVTGNIGVTGTVDGIDIAARDAILTSTTTTAGAALPKAGGTMTGSLIVNSGTSTVASIQLNGGANSAANDNSSIFSKYSLVLNADSTNAISGRTINLRNGGTDKLVVSDTAITTTIPMHVVGASSVRNSIVANLTLDGGTLVQNPYHGFGFGINFTGRDYGNAVRNYAHIYSSIEDYASSSGGGDAGFESLLSFSTNSGGASDTNPTEKMRITSAGNVGIGTTSPTEKLSVLGGHVSVGDTTGVSGTEYLLEGYREVSGGTKYGNTSIRTTYNIGSNASDMLFYTASGGTNTDERMRIDASGNVGIGTSVVTNAGLWYDANPGYLAISHWATPPTPAAMLHLSDNSNDLDVPQIRIEGRENAGDTKLDISVKDAGVRLNLIEGPGADASNGYGLMEFKTNAASNTSNPGIGGFKFITPANANNLVIANTGNVGIGTNAPGTILHTRTTGANTYSSTITKGTNHSGLTLVQKNNANDMTGVYFATGTGDDGTHWSGITGSRSDYSSTWETQLNFYAHPTAHNNIADANQVMVIKGSGNVGIGTTNPSAKIHLHTTGSEDIALGFQNSERYYKIHTDGGNLRFTDVSAGLVERMSILANGNVGIGTATPDYTLEVEGVSGTTVAIKTPWAQDAYGQYKFATTVGEASMRSRVPGNSTVGLEFYTYGTNNGTAKMSIDGSGNVGIGASSASGSRLRLDNGGTSGAPQLMLTATGASTQTEIRHDTSNNLIFDNWNSGRNERMRIDSSGNLLVGKTTTSVGTAGTVIHPMQTKITNNAATPSLTTNQLGWGGITCAFMYTGAVKGYIETTSTAVAYVTSSDYRLKEDVQAMSGATDRLKELKPVNFAWKEDGSRVDGFLAHEAQAVVPECVTGTKDAMRDEEYEVTAAIEEVRDEDDNITTEAVEAVMGTRSVPDYQGIDQAKLVPLLTAALQEAITKIESLTARIEALEA